jgi:valyl-tRNA synthetase
MPRNFDFASEESRLYMWWESNGWFKPEVAPPDAEPYVIAIPPPNVTGELHLGHAIFVSLEDLMIRYERMRGKAALWIPGTDHAGIATQLQVEKALASEGLTRDDIGREEFIARTWDWTRKYGGMIKDQLRRMGASVDWSRERFTLDDGLSEAVLKVFVEMYDQGLIYRGPRLVNWSPGLQTAVSDVEVERSEETLKLYYFKYPVEGGEHIPVATTRPETILGDAAVAVHPEDERYQHLIGRKAYVPMLNREIPVIGDESVDREFGTGALKITPAHDFADYDLAQRHNLPLINVMTRKATLNENAGPYQGLTREACRIKLWADMEAAGMTLKIEDYVTVVPRTQRGGEIVEPMISTQWFATMKPLADKAIASVRSGEIRIVPERFEKVFFNWLENIQDWCVSRQLWWGHRIPAWYGPNGEVYVGTTPPAGDGWTPEHDVLDTWFSSGLWPFSTLGWPEETEDFKRFYPTSMLETGYDILFFWVARMVMLGLWFTDKPPFHTVYLHGLVRDKLGRKISKTLGNVINPLDLVDQYGADPLRFTLVTSGTPGNDINLDDKRVEGEWRFVNKLWQMTNFVTSSLPGDGDAPLPKGLPANSELDLPSRWVLSRLNTLIDTVQRLFDSYQYGEAGRQIRSFLWDDFADWYIEASKFYLYGEDAAGKTNVLRVLVHVLDQSLRLLHPYMPYVTESAWQYLPHEGQTISLAAWPVADQTRINARADDDMATLIDLIRGVRNVRLEYNVEPGRRVTAIVSGGSHTETIAGHKYLFSRLCNIERIDLITEGAPEDAATIVASDAALYLPLAGLIDYAAEIERLEKEQDKLNAMIAKSQGMLANENFVNRARPDVVQKERDNLTELQASHARNAERLAQLKQR